MCSAIVPELVSPLRPTIHSDENSDTVGFLPFPRAVTHSDLSSQIKLLGEQDARGIKAFRRRGIMARLCSFIHTKRPNPSEITLFALNSPLSRRRRRPYWNVTVVTLAATKLPRFANIPLPVTKLRHFSLGAS